MVAFAIASDVAAGWRPLTVVETAVATELIERASALIRSQVPGIDARLVLDANLAIEAKTVCADMVQRVLLNPESKRQESIDDYAWTRDNAVSSGMLYLAPDERLRLLAPVAQLGGAFVASLGG